MSSLKQNWNLESIFPGGSDSPELKQHLEQERAKISAFQEQVSAAQEQIDVTKFKNLVAEIQNITASFGQAAAFVGCLLAQDVRDEKARLIQGSLGQIRAEFSSVMADFDSILLNISDEEWQTYLEDPLLQELSFSLDEQRKTAKIRMNPELESLAGDLAVDGYHAWSHLYNNVVGQLTIEVERDGKIETMSVGQASNLLSNPDPQLRKSVFEKIEKVFTENEAICSSALNHIAGFRINLYKHRGWDDILAEPLLINRMEKATLDAMWSAVKEAKPQVVQYLERKAKLLGLEQIAWYDVNAPVGDASKEIPYGEGADFVVEQFGKFSPELAEFTRTALDQGWVEAEDRGGKRPGAFCTSFPMTGESRVFMTYSSTIQSLGTLAHELGHAYHAHVLKDAPIMHRNYAMNVAETASTFSELLVVDGTLQAARSHEEKIGILDDKIGRSVAFFMDIHSRFLFETRFYAARKNGPVSSLQLNELMIQAQKDAFLDSLKEYHPHFWASKLHFYITGTPFYNFPYTFGYLFSAGVYARAKTEGAEFANKYRDLLQDTAKMNVETLAKKHLGADLTKLQFWQDAVKLSINDIEEFLELTK